MIYCIDTSALIDLDRLYPKEVFPSLWEKHIVEIVEEGRFISPHEVREELERKDDDLWNWIKSNCKNLFLRDSQPVIDRVAELQTRFEGWVNPENPQKNMADPFVVALALEAHNIIPEINEKERNHCNHP